MIYHSYETTHAMVLFKEAVEDMLQRHWREVTPRQLLKVDALLHLLAGLLALDIAREEERQSGST